MRRVATVLALAVASVAAYRLLLAPAEEPVVGPVAPTRAAEVVRAPEGPGVTELSVEVISERPHDPEAFTQGLELRDGVLFESTGEFGRSSLRRVDPDTGAVELEAKLPPDLFGEGLTIVGDRLIQLTWQSGVALVWSAATLERLETFRYDGEGWGLCYDGGRLVMSDGTDLLTLRSPETFEELGRVRVTLNGRPLRHLNELECVDGAVWANVWHTDRIVRIDPFSGRADAVVDASGLLAPGERSRTDVLNGIAWNPEAGTWFVTGKLWPTLFEVRFVESRTGS